MVNTVEKIEYINCKLNGTNPNCTSSIRVESWDKNFAIRMNKSNNNLQQKLQSPSGPHAAVCSKLKEDIKRWDFWKPTKMPNIKQKVALITGKLQCICVLYTYIIKYIIFQVGSYTNKSNCSLLLTIQSF